MRGGSGEDAEQDGEQGEADDACQGEKGRGLRHDRRPLKSEATLKAWEGSGRLRQDSCGNVIERHVEAGPASEACVGTPASAPPAPRLTVHPPGSEGAASLGQMAAGDPRGQSTAIEPRPGHGADPQIQLSFRVTATLMALQRSAAGLDPADETDLPCPVGERGGPADEPDGQDVDRLLIEDQRHAGMGRRRVRPSLPPLHFTAGRAVLPATEVVRSGSRPWGEGPRGAAAQLAENQQPGRQQQSRLPAVSAPVAALRAAQ